MFLTILQMGFVVKLAAIIHTDFNMQILFELPYGYIGIGTEEDIFTSDHPLPRVNDKVIAYWKGYYWTGDVIERKLYVYEIIYNYSVNIVTVYLGELE